MRARENRFVGLLGDRATAPVVAAALLFAGLAVALEVALKLPVRLPGHRALPGALAVLLFAESFAPLLLLALSAAVPLSLGLLGFSPAWAVAGWVGPALLLIALPRTWARSLLVFVLIGLLFGLIRYLTLLTGLHHTPEALRLAGHLCFGGIGGLLAFAISRSSKR